MVDARQEEGPQRPLLMVLHRKGHKKIVAGWIEVHFKLPKSDPDPEIVTSGVK